MGDLTTYELATAMDAAATLTGILAGVGLGALAGAFIAVFNSWRV